MNKILEQIQYRAAALPLASQAELLNYAVYLELTARKARPAVSPKVRRERLAAALAQAVELNPFADITDPVAWEREERQDRSLPGRNNAD
jgi:hypothetical protein